GKGFRRQFVFVLLSQCFSQLQQYLQTITIRRAMAIGPEHESSIYWLNKIGNALLELINTIWIILRLVKETKERDLGGVRITFGGCEIGLRETEKPTGLRWQGKFCEGRQECL